MGKKKGDLAKGNRIFSQTTHRAPQTRSYTSRAERVIYVAASQSQDHYPNGGSKTISPEVKKKDAKQNEAALTQ